VKKAGAVGAGVLAEEEKRVCLLQVFPDDGADGRTNHLAQANRGGFVAHIRALRQIVIAVQSRHQCVKIGGLKPGMTGRIENRAFGIERVEVIRDVFERRLPVNFFVAIAL